MSYPVTMNELLKTTAERDASDLHIVVGSPPSIRVHGELSPLSDQKLTPDDARELIMAILNDEQKQELDKHLEIDLAYSLPHVSRFRVNVAYQRSTLCCSLRAIPAEPPLLESMDFPAAVAEVTNLPRGLVLVTGPTGSGKSTTLASMINYINRNRRLRIVTIEDPIEFLHANDKSLITQREVGRDTHSTTAALRSTLRQDPDVILVGEMRDLDTIGLAITAAETGHLVFATLHTTSAPEAINRVIDVFPPDRQELIRMQLSTVFQAVFTQTLVPRAQGTGRVCAMEIMLGNAAVRNLIRENKPNQLVTSIQTGAQQGMQTMEKHLGQLVNTGAITLEQAMMHTSHPGELQRIVGAAGPAQEAAPPTAAAPMGKPKYVGSF